MAANGSSSPLDDVENIVVLMMENRSFDQMLGYLSLMGMRDVDGLQGGEVNYDEDGKPYYSRAFAPNETAFRLPGKEGMKALDPDHSPEGVAEQLAGNNGGFVKNFIKKKKPPADKRDIVMGHYTAEHLPVYDFLARQYCICDAWHSSVPGDTWPNRLYAMAGRTGPTIFKKPGLLNRIFRYLAKVPALRDLSGAPIFEVEAFTRQLEDADWRWYSHDPATLRAADRAYRDFGDLKSDNFSYFNRRKMSPLTKLAEAPIVGGGSFLDDAAAGKLPPVSWIDPNFVDLRVLDPNSDDDHPPSDVRAGQALVLEVYEALVNSPQWKNTVLVITYDEHGGFYDHVVPPAAPDDDPERPRLGVRVPALVVGPRVRKGVYKETLEHTSLPHTILRRFAKDPERALKKMPDSVRKSRDLSDVLLDRARDDIEDHGFLHEKIETWRKRARRDHRARREDRRPARSPASEGAGQPPDLHDFQEKFVKFALAMRDHGLPPGHP